ncbi:Uncharacterised protein [Mycobacteroides abscessus subsp. abscessus]|nr:Uncharacterised protein [Mycobacteroides abscessus subsp. abscessus]
MSLCLPCNCPNNSAVVVAAPIVARTGTVLISKPTIDSAPSTSAGRPETVVPNATSPCPHNELSSNAHAPCNTTLTVVCCERASFVNARVVRRGTRNRSTLRRPNCSFCGGPRSVGASNPAIALRHACWAAT